MWSKDLLNNLYYALTNKENPLHLVCRNELPKILSEKLSQENVSHEVQLAVVFQTFTRLVCDWSQCCIVGHFKILYSVDSAQVAFIWMESRILRL